MRSSWMEPKVEDGSSPTVGPAHPPELPPIFLAGPTAVGKSALALCLAKQIRGEIVSVDCGVYKSGYHGDAARTYIIGEVDPAVRQLVDVTRECLLLGIEQAVEGNRLHDISAAIEKHARSFGYSVIENMVGHGIGSELHEEPAVPNYGRPHTGVKLRSGMTLAIEPMIAIGRSRRAVSKRGAWVAVTEDGRHSAHFEHTIAIGKGPAEILTK